LISEPIDYYEYEKFSTIDSTYRSIELGGSRQIDQTTMERARATGERRQPTHNPYSLFILQSVNATGCLAWEERRAWMFREGVQAGVDSWELTYNRSTSIATVGVRKIEQETEWN
jgi:hypothetical protein